MNWQKLSEEEWRDRLTADEYHVLREEGTEPAFSGEYWGCHEKGMYHCAACGAALFPSETKFDSGSGWPSFWNPVNQDLLAFHQDFKLLYPRTAVRCKRCGSHLGHVFDDGPPPTEKRYCLNSTALRFIPK